MRLRVSGLCPILGLIFTYSTEAIYPPGKMQGYSTTFSGLGPHKLTKVCQVRNSKVWFLEKLER